MISDRITMQFCGFGGQGIILSSVIFGTAAVLHSNMNAVQTQSFGSESRGGECQAELILSNQPIISPLANQLDILIAMSQPALRQYLKRLKSSGTLLYDPEYVLRPDREDIKIIPVPATESANRLGNKLAANMFMLGFLQQMTHLVTDVALCKVIRQTVSEKFLTLNISAAQNGMAMAKEMNAVMEI